MDTDKYASDAAASADKIANKLHTGIRDTYQGAKTAESKLADKADDAVGQVKGRIKDGVKGVRDAVDSAREALSDSSESILTFTREKPVQALLIAAVSGAVLWTLARALSSRD
jgi:ElaB/YqjD/DUF883 family membrane-anchored ribosome-binding protein